MKSTNTDPRLVAARQAMAAGQPEDVRRLLAPMLTGTRPSAEGLFMLGAAFRRLGRVADALAALQKAELLAPGQDAIAFETASLLVELERFPEALARLEMLAMRHPNDPAIIQLRAAVLVHLNRFREGLDLAGRLPPGPARADLEARALLGLGREMQAAERLAALPRLHAFKLVGGQPSGSLPLSEQALQSWLGGPVARPQ